MYTRLMDVKIFTLLAALQIGAALAQARDSNSCESLKGLSLPDASVMLAEARPNASYTVTGLGMPPYTGRGGPADRSVRLPGHCRVVAAIKPTADSDIRVDLWLPANGWNRKVLGVGNGGWSGSIRSGAMVSALVEGYATASTDTGHEGNSASFALGHPEKLIDFEYRAVHEMTTKAKAIIMQFYGSGPQHSYWNGCSGGGKQGLKEAQRYPADYDGIVTGAPTNYKTHMHAWQMNLSHSALSDKASYIPPSKYGLINSAVLAACDALDGIRDGILNDPRKCHFDPGVLLCRGSESGDCLTAPQVEMARKMYAPVIDRQTGKVIYPGLEPGTELGWAGLIGGPQPFGLAHDLFRYLVHKDANWDWHSFDLERDTAAADSEYKDTMNALEPDLRAFAGHGGKLILWHGLSDPFGAPQNTIDYYRSVIGVAGSKREEFVRLFLAPGVQHCGGGSGPNQFQVVAALERWVEGGIAPDQMLAAHVTENQVDMTRPLCPYPQVAQWKGVGSTNDASNFVCK